LRERPFDHRIVLVTGWLGDAVAASGGSGAHDLGATGDDPVELHLDSPDGTLEAVFVLT